MGDDKFSNSVFNRILDTVDKVEQFIRKMVST
jgi:hypothetical protein